MNEVVYCSELPAGAIAKLLRPYGIHLQWIDLNSPIPGSHFGEPEAGLIGKTLYIRKDTPIHSALHEACHYICMEPERRQQLHTDAGGDYDEENAVCYLSILLAEKISGYNASQMMSDMDSWGYTFRLGSARRWFENDAEDARDWLQTYNIIDYNEAPSGMIRLNEY